MIAKEKEKKKKKLFDTCAFTNKMEKYKKKEEEEGVIP